MSHTNPSSRSKTSETFPSCCCHHSDKNAFFVHSQSFKQQCTCGKQLRDSFFFPSLPFPSPPLKKEVSEIKWVWTIVSVKQSDVFKITKKMLILVQNYKFFVLQIVFPWKIINFGFTLILNIMNIMAFWKIQRHCVVLTNTLLCK